MRPLPIRATAAVVIFGAAILGFESGVTLSDAEGELPRSLAVNAYYALSLFVIGGIDIGTPMAGSPWAIILLWFAYFAAPILAVSTLLDLFLRLFTRNRWRMQRLRNHVIIEGDDDLARAYLRHLRRMDPRRQVVVVSATAFTRSSRAQLEQGFDALTWEGELIDDFTFDQLRVRHAAKVLFFSDHSLRNFEAVKSILDRRPKLAGRIVLQVSRLRFMRAMLSSRVAQSVNVFNGYQFAAENLVRTVVVPQVRQSESSVAVVIAGFGRFGQSVFETLQAQVSDRVDAVVVIEHEAERRVMVTREQVSISTDFELKVLQGDMEDPSVWHDVDRFWDTTRRDTLFILATNREEDNLRTALWLRRRNSEALIFSRLRRASSFAEEVGVDHNIIAMSPSQLIEQSMPDSWFDCSL